MQRRWSASCWVERRRGNDTDYTQSRLQIAVIGDWLEPVTSALSIRPGTRTDTALCGKTRVFMRISSGQPILAHWVVHRRLWAECGQDCGIRSASCALPRAPAGAADGYKRPRLRRRCGPSAAPRNFDPWRRTLPARPTLTAASSYSTPAPASTLRLAAPSSWTRLTSSSARSPAPITVSRTQSPAASTSTAATSILDAGCASS